MLASGGFDGTVRLWAARTGDALATLLGDERGIEALAFALSQATLAAGAEDGNVRL